MSCVSGFEARWQKKLGCPNVGEICWCPICIGIEKRLEAGRKEAHAVLKEHLETKEDSPEKDAMLEMLAVISLYQY